MSARTGFALTASTGESTPRLREPQGVWSAPWIRARPVPQIPAACFHPTDLPTACRIRTAAMTR
ncbi:MAG: hypothetical protein UIB31_07180 [Methanobrevibacter sp.]|nr:hypothetical protein [Methanobrevibacter sp.]